MTMLQDQETLTLFDNLGTWRDEPMLAFTSLVRSQRYAESSRSREPQKEKRAIRKDSIRVYEFMFQKFLGQLKVLQVNFLGVDVRQMDLFMQAGLGGATKETVSRYIRLLERVYAHLVDQQMLPANPVSAWVQQKNLEGGLYHLGKESAPPAIISKAEVERLQDWLYTKGVTALDAGEWRQARDMTVASLSLGSGMRCAELLKLECRRVKHWPDGPRSECFEFDIPPVATVTTSKVHSTMANVECVALMERYWHARQNGFPRRTSRADQGQGTLHLPGEFVFPGNLAGGPMEANAMFRNLRRLSVDAVEAGILNDSTQWVLRRGAQGLRRAYALTEIGVQPDQLLRHRLGHHKERSLRRYRSALASNKTLLGRAS